MNVMDKIKSQPWYRQGGAVMPYYTFAAYQRGFELFDGLNFFQGFNNYGYFGMNKEKSIVMGIVNKQLKDKNYIYHELIEPWQRLRKEQNEKNKHITVDFASKLSDTELINVIQEFFKFQLKIWKIAILIESFDPWGDQVIADFQKKYEFQIKSEDLAILLGPTKLSFVQKECLDRLKLAKNKNIKSDLQNHVLKYHWMHNSWAEVHYLDEDHFNTLIENDKNTNIDKRIRELESFEKEIQEKQAQLYDTYNPPEELKNLFIMFSALTDWRDERKKNTMMVNHTSHLFLSEINKRIGIDEKYLVYLDYTQIENIKGIINLKEELVARRNAYIYWFNDDKVLRRTGKEALELHGLLEKSIQNEEGITGRIANNGIAKGKVKIVISRKDFYKVNSGDIIVAQMTRPEFSPILHKAAAIVTDEGGITCHAAIVSRELGIPCIVATQTATSLLNDNDLIEVDANKGIIKIIK